MALTLSPEPIPLSLAQDGTLLVAGTRIPLETLINDYLHGIGPEQMALDYPGLSKADAYAVVFYYLRHPEEVRAYLAQQAERAEQARLTYFPSTPRLDPQDES